HTVAGPGSGWPTRSGPVAHGTRCYVLSPRPLDVLERSAPRRGPARYCGLAHGTARRTLGKPTSKRRDVFAPAPSLPKGPGAYHVLRVNSRRCVAAEHLFTVLIHGGEVQVDKRLAVFLANGFHRGFGRERIPWPDLLGETHTEFGEAPIPHIVRQHRQIGRASCRERV